MIMGESWICHIIFCGIEKKILASEIIVVHHATAYSYLQTSKNHIKYENI